MNKALHALYEVALETIDKEDDNYFEKVFTFASIFVEVDGMVNKPELEDLRDGPFGGVSLADAVSKLQFELKNDVSLYSGYRDNMSRILFDTLTREAGQYLTDEDRIYLHQLTDVAAKNFLDEYISLLKEE